MKVKTLKSTDDAEKLVCASARGDYMADWNGEKSFEDIMSTVSYNDDHYERAIENNYYPNEKPQTEARVIAFIEKQLSRGHYGPAEHPQIAFTVKGVSRVLMAQITRHRHMSFDVQSMRYVDFSHKHAIVPPILLSDEERREEYPHIFNDSTDHFNRQDGLVDLDEEVRERCRERYTDFVEEAVFQYDWLTAEGMPDEDARFVLPLGTPVNMTFSGNARTMLHLLDMRKKANAQWEIRELSERLLDELFDWMPYTFNYYEQHGSNKLSP